jgi:anti-sigma28 factor (negative regulator of flagellin synthesis)
MRIEHPDRSSVDALRNGRTSGPAAAGNDRRAGGAINTDRRDRQLLTRATELSEIVAGAAGAVPSAERAAHLAALRASIAAGRYQLEPQAIARAMVEPTVEPREVGRR